MDEFVLEHERELLEELNYNPEWFYMVTATVSVGGRAAVMFSKREQMPLKLDAQLQVVSDMIQEIRMQAGMEGIIVMGDPYAYWAAGWSHHG